VLDELRLQRVDESRKALFYLSKNKDLDTTHTHTHTHTHIYIYSSFLMLCFSKLDFMPNLR
jgi:hypothetical protein